MEIKEIWKTIEGYENYQISSLGRVKSLGNNKTKKEKILKQGICRGYYFVVLSQENKAKKYYVHKLVASAFLSNPQNLPQVNHKDENKQNNCVSNLEFCTQEYNINYGTRNERCAKALKGRVFSQETKDKLSKVLSKPILQFNREGTKILGKFNSAMQAEIELGIDDGSIGECCKGKRKSAGNYRWMYLQDYIDRMEKLYQLTIKKAS